MSNVLQKAIARAIYDADPVTMYLSDGGEALSWEEAPGAVRSACLRAADGVLAEVIYKRDAQVEQAVRASVAAEIRAAGSCGNGCKYAPERFARIAEGKQP